MTNKLKIGKSQKLYQKAKTLIPGGTQLLSKRPEMFLPELWPAYYAKANGCTVWDLDGKKYFDLSYMGLGACVLGYQDRDVNRAVINAIKLGNETTLNAPEEVELAELLIKLHPWAQMARYARSGGEAMAIAVRIARAATEKDIILFCGYHGWHDWYLAANLAEDTALDGHLLPGLKPRGVPRGLLGTAIPFIYNNTEEFKRLFAKYHNKLAAVVMEPIRNHSPKPEFLETIREQTNKMKIPLIFDEITSGFRLAVGGAHLKLGINPDIAVFAKGMSNGYPMAAVIGQKRFMEYTQESFISSTNWTDRIGPTAALATIRKYKTKQVPKYLEKIGKTVQDGWKQLQQTYKLKLQISGIYPLGHFSFEYENAQAVKTLLIQTMLEKGFLTSTAFYASLAHTEKIVAEYLAALDETFNTLKKAIDTNGVEKQLQGPVAQSGFRRLT